MAGERTSNGPSVPWIVLIGSATFLIGIVGLAGGASWTVFQTQLGGLQHQLDSLRRDSEKSDDPGGGRRMARRRLPRCIGHNAAAI